MSKQVKDDSANAKAYVDNYPPLQDFLQEVEARCNWQVGIGPSHNPTYIEQWQTPNGRTMIVTVRPGGMGWDIATPCDELSIVGTLADVRRRLGLETAEPGVEGAVNGDEYPRKNIVLFARAFSYEGAENISHITLDGERTACGRKDWATEEGWSENRLSPVLRGVEAPLFRGCVGPGRPRGRGRAPPRGRVVKVLRRTKVVRGRVVREVVTYDARRTSLCYDVHVDGRLHAASTDRVRALSIHDIVVSKLREGVEL